MQYLYSKIQNLIFSNDLIMIYLAKEVKWGLYAIWRKFHSEVSSKQIWKEPQTWPGRCFLKTLINCWQEKFKAEITHCAGMCNFSQDLDQNHFVITLFILSHLTPLIIKTESAGCLRYYSKYKNCDISIHFDFRSSNFSYVSISGSIGINLGRIIEYHTILIIRRCLFACHFSLQCFSNIFLKIVTSINWKLIVLNLAVGL